MTFMGEKNVFEQEITVDNAMGLHARPAAQLVIDERPDDTVGSH